MKTLDLHGIRHDEAEILVENFILLNETPLEIISGNSLKIQDIVKATLHKHSFRWHYKNFINFGSLIIE